LLKWEKEDGQYSTKRNYGKYLQERVYDKKEDCWEVTLLEKIWWEICQQKNMESESFNDKSFHRKGLKKI
jgi:hypothetical protein